MDTPINITTTTSKSAFVRGSLILAGIVIALICSFILSNTTSAETGSSQPSSIVISDNMLVKSAAVIGHSVVMLSNQ